MQGDNPSASGSFVECCDGLTTCAGVSASEIDESRFDALHIAQLQRVLSCNMTIKKPLARGIGTAKDWNMLLGFLGRVSCGQMGNSKLW